MGGSWRDLGFEIGLERGEKLMRIGLHEGLRLGLLGGSKKVMGL